MKIRDAMNFPWYPLLLAVLPVARFFEANFRSYLPGTGVRITLLYLLLAAMFLPVFGALFRSRHRGAWVFAPLVVVATAGVDVGVPWSVVLLIFAAASGVFFFVRRPDFARATLPLNAACLVLLLLPIGSAVLADRRETPPTPTPLFNQPLTVNPPPSAAKPDVWYLLVDGLGRPEIVESRFEIDRNRYSELLRRRGFQVIEHSNANYQQTGLSVAATWNAAHVDELLALPDPASHDRRVLNGLFGGSRVARTFRDLGYRLVDVPSSYPMTRLSGPDARAVPFLAPTLVEFAILEMSGLPMVHLALGRGPSDLSFALRRRNLTYIFDELPDVRDDVPADEPALIFAHVLAPHPPFVFTATGGARQSEMSFEFSDGSHWLDRHGWAAGRYAEKYRDQAIYVMWRLAETIDRILAQAVRPTVIIVQGDHGPGSRLDWERPGRTDHAERFGIFNAWYASPGLDIALPPEMSAINTFPVLFNGLFGSRLPMQPDRFLVSKWSRPYDFMTVGE